MKARDSFVAAVWLAGDSQKSSEKGQNLARRAVRRLPPAIGKKPMPHDFRLLFKTVVFEAPTRLKHIFVAAEGVSHQREVEPAAPLSLPNMGQFMDEKSLPM